VARQAHVALGLAVAVGGLLAAHLARGPAKVQGPAVELRIEDLDLPARGRCGGSDDHGRRSHHGACIHNAATAADNPACQAACHN
jgi:hypothetical protein